MVYHFVGIGGYGMSGLALILAEAGLRVQGSDVRPSSRTGRLRQAGVDVRIGHDPRHVDGAGVVIRSTDVPDHNPELEEARRRGLPLWHRSDVLARILNPNRGIAVAGTHGKTTTTAMTACALLDAGLDPTVSVGGEVARWQGTGRLGASPWVVAEACESDGTFTRYRPEIAVLTNVEPEHLDHYGGSFEALKDAFRAFAAGVKPGGLILACADDPTALAVARSAAGTAAPGVRLETYGFADGAGFQAVDAAPAPDGWSFDVVHRGRRLGRVRLSVPGRHNVANALAALAAAVAAGVPFEAAAGSLAGYTGAQRRFQVLASGDVTVVDDYAHHPTEIRAVLQTARERAGAGRVVAVFQPQRYTRTRSLWDGFAGAFAGADAVILTEIYSPPGEEPLPGVSGRALAEAVAAASGVPVRFAADRDRIPDLVEEWLEPGAVVVFMGAGDIWKVAHDFARRPRVRPV
ncbi:MAG: UDP-N-acetylmuramate--L-alanine ligase [Bacillota bacterium]|nr:MAG: UDP-N-acetylmuramate--L-alanine ligase [Bacillota bacterium]